MQCAWDIEFRNCSSAFEGLKVREYSLFAEKLHVEYEDLRELHEEQDPFAQVNLCFWLFFSQEL